METNRRIQWITLALAATTLIHADGPPDEVAVSDIEKQTVKARLHAILDPTVLPEWAGVVLPLVDLRFDRGEGRWTKSPLSFVECLSTRLTARYYQKRDCLFRYTVYPSWLDDWKGKPEDLMSVDAVRTRTENLLATIYPKGWQVELVDSTRKQNVRDEIAAFDWDAKYRGYSFRRGSHFEVDRLTGTIIEYDLNFGFFPKVQDEDCPTVSEATLAALRAEGHRVYASYRPLARANVSAGRLVLIVPAFTGHPNEMTARHYRRMEDKEAILACLVVAFGQEQNGDYCQQLIYVDATTGRPIGIYDEPLTAEGLGPSSGPVPNLKFDIARTKWSILASKKGQSFKLTRSGNAASLRSDGKCILVTDSTRTMTFEVDLKQRKLWINSPKGKEAWCVPDKTWKLLAASLASRKPFPVAKSSAGAAPSGGKPR